MNEQNQINDEDRYHWYNPSNSNSVELVRKGKDWFLVSGDDLIPTTISDVTASMLKDTDAATLHGLRLVGAKETGSITISPDATINMEWGPTSDNDQWLNYGKALAKLDPIDYIRKNPLKFIRVANIWSGSKPKE